MSVANGSDELWVAKKFQSNLAIAGSPRNRCRASLVRWRREVEHWLGAGSARGTNLNQTANARRLGRESATGR